MKVSPTYSYTDGPTNRPTDRDLRDAAPPNSSLPSWTILRRKRTLLSYYFPHFSDHIRTVKRNEKFCSPDRAPPPPKSPPPPPLVWLGEPLFESGPSLSRSSRSEAAFSAGLMKEGTRWKEMARPSLNNWTLASYEATAAQRPRPGSASGPGDDLPPSLLRGS